MSTLAERLTSVMADKGLSQAELARIIGIKQPSIFKIMSGQTLNPKNILEIANALDVDPHWLKTGEGIRDLISVSSLMSAEKDDEHRFRIDYLDVKAAAAMSGFVNDDYPEVIQSIYFSRTGLFEVVGKGSAEGLSLINVPTDSMSPTINKGDVVFVDTRINHYCGEGVYMFVLNDETYIKRLMKLPTGVFKVISDNKLYPEFDIDDVLFSTAQILGKFIRVLPINPRDL